MWGTSWSSRSFFKLNVSGKDEGECCDAADTLEGALQAAIESDRQLGGLCNQILFVGGIEFANEATGGDGGKGVALYGADIGDNGGWRRRVIEKASIRISLPRLLHLLKKR
jgi:hypothetical protein